MSAHSRSNYEKHCLDCGTRIVTKFALRCKSCAAKERLRVKPNHEQLEAARARSLAWMAEIPSGSERLDVERLRHAIYCDGRSHRQLEVDANLARGHIAHILSRKACGEATLEKLASALGVHWCELEAVA
jgi:hypothetical protein